MTAITLNLLAEEQIAQQERARDPVKAALAVGVGLIAVAVAAGAIMSVVASQKKSEVAGLQAQYDKLNSPALQEQETRFAALQKEANAMVQVNHTRYLLAPRLALLKDLLPDNVRLDHVMFSVMSETVQPESGPTGRAARPKTIEHLKLRLNGQVVSNRPELDVDAFMQMLRKNPAFSADMDQIQLQSVTRNAAGSQAGVDQLPAADFAVECLYEERK